MAQRIIIWDRQAESRLIHLGVWYKENMGTITARKVTDRIFKTVEMLSSMPTIGTLVDRRESKTYRCFVEHPKCSILYWYDENELHIVRLIMNQMLH